MSGPKRTATVLDKAIGLQGDFIHESSVLGVVSKVQSLFARRALGVEQ